MTHPIEGASVEQADRIEASRLMISRECEERALNGQSDTNPMVQAFARHRQQARDAGFAEGVERAAEVVNYGIERAERDWRNPDKQDAVKQVCTEIAEVLKYLSAEANEGRCDGR